MHQCAHLLGVATRLARRFDPRHRVPGDRVAGLAADPHPRDPRKSDLGETRDDRSSVLEPGEDADALAAGRGRSLVGIEQAGDDGPFGGMGGEQGEVVGARDLDGDAATGEDDRTPQGEEREVGGERDVGRFAHERKCTGLARFRTPKHLSGLA